MANSPENLSHRLTTSVSEWIDNNPILTGLAEFAGEVRGNRIIEFSLLFLLFVTFLAVFGNVVMPYEYDARHYSEDGELLRRAPPSLDHPLGTNEGGQDVLSRVIYGAQPTLLTGALGGLFILSIGLTVGVTAGYHGGWVDEVLMRAVDVLYGIPFIPFAVVLLGFIGIGFWSTILLIGLLLWRGNSRIFRSQVLQLKERSYVRSAKASGASDLYIIVYHILPNMVGMIILFLALGIGISILLAAGLAFLGFLNPFIPSWGVMIRNAYNSGFLVEAWWWSMPPGFMISWTILSTYLIGREYERLQESKTQREVL